MDRGYSLLFCPAQSSVRVLLAVTRGIFSTLLLCDIILDIISVSVWQNYG